MNIETKYNIGDYVYPIQKDFVPEYIMCNTCEGTGIIFTLNKVEKLICPKCYGRGGKQDYKFTEWITKDSLYSKIGLIISTVREGNNIENKYMIESTGIGSGTFWYEDDLFSNVREGDEECIKRNKNEKC